MERNFRSRWGELDLIAVKINESDYENEMYFDETAEGMNAKLRKTALVWLQEQEQYYSDLCFDVIEVWVVGKTAKIRWLKSCF